MLALGQLDLFYIKIHVRKMLIIVMQLPSLTWPLALSKET